MRQIWDASKIATAAAPMTVGESFYQPGRTAIFLNGDWTGLNDGAMVDNAHTRKRR